MPDLDERVRLRLRDEMARQQISQRDLCGLLGGWSQSRLAKILTGRVEMTVNDLGALCFALGVSVVEVVRDQGLEFLAEMTPTELRFIERLRQLPKPYVEAIMQLSGTYETTRRLQQRRALETLPPARRQKKV